MKVTYHDIEAVDPDYYKNLKWMLEVSNYLCLSVVCKSFHIRPLVLDYFFFWVSIRMM